MTRTLLCTSLCMSLATGAALAAAPQDRTAPARPATPPTAPARPATPPAAPAATPPAGAVPQMDEKTAKEMAAWATAMMPGLEHQKLAARTGTWDLDMKMWMAPGMPPMESKGEATCEMVLGGRFLRETVKSEFMGSPFEGIGYLGYDNAAKKYVLSWLDTAGTGVMSGVGDLSADSKTLNMTMTMTSPVTGKPETSRSTSTMVDPTTMKMESFMTGPDGKEFKSMELVYKRRGGAKPAGTPAATPPATRPAAPAAPTAPSRPTAPPTRPTTPPTTPPTR